MIPNIFERSTDDEMEDMFDREDDQVRVKSWLKQSVHCHVADVEIPNS